MALAFLHGEIIVAWFLAGALTLLVGSLLALGLWLYPPRSPLLLSAIYLSLAIVFMALWTSDESSLAMSSLGFAFSMPWSALAMFAILEFQIEITVWVIWPGLNPTVNSYKRFGPDTLAPWLIDWGLDNRSAMLRIPPERGSGDPP